MLPHSPTLAALGSGLFMASRTAHLVVRLEELEGIVYKGLNVLFCCTFTTVNHD
jgi:hypothetical protein